jgi:translocation and assembly module TamB
MAIGRKKYWILAALIGLPVAAIAYAWNQRVPIAQDYIDDSLAAKGVPARYTIRNLGRDMQRLENVSIGDPARPDLTADWVEIDTSIWLLGYEIKAVRAGGVRLRGALKDGKVSLGALDRLLPAPTGEPFKLPDIEIALTNGVASFTTPYGPIGLVLREAKGNPAKVFVADGALASRALKYGGIDLAEARGALTIKLVNGAAQVTGPVSLAQASGMGIRAAGVSTKLDINVADGKFTGKAPLLIGRASGQGVSLRDAAVSLEAKGDSQFGAIDFSARGSSKIDSAPGVVLSSARFAIEGRASKDGLERLAGPVWLDDVRPQKAQLSSIQGQLGAFGGTPIEPIMAGLRSAIGGLERGSTLEARISCGRAGGKLGCLAEPSLLVAKSGLTVRGAGASLSFGSAGSSTIKGQYTIAGGGFPSVTVNLSGTADDLAFSTGAISMLEGGSALALTPISGRVSNGALRLETNIRLSGGVGGGRIEGLSLPVSIKPGQTPLAGCFAPRFERFTLQDLRLNAATLSLCRKGDAFELRPLALNGVLGRNPLKLTASGGRVTVPTADFAFRDVAVRLAAGDAPTNLALTALNGTFGRGGADGRFVGASGNIANVPLKLSEGVGVWSFRNGVFLTKANLMVADAAADYRYVPLQSPDFSLRLENGKIDARGSLIHPKSGRKISLVTIQHDLGRGAGQATLDVAGLEFDDQFQPEELTPLTLGVVANVRGAVRGTGTINWTPNGVTSGGKFFTENTNLAAAFGPVEGLKAEISLSDLLNLETSEVQTIRLGSVNPGIAVVDGDIQYRLLPGRKVEILAGKWPFAGGFLILEPTVLDLGQEVERRLTFRVEGIDIARFIAAMQFDNIAATGIFDGTLPMVFDASGGRIDKGRLDARSGGTLSYIGQISNENMSGMAQFAFDALRSLKYDRLSVDMDGAIDGDVITRISFAGVNQQPLGLKRAKLPIPVKITGLDNIPFIFNVKITAKFRQLFEMTRSFNDPSILINRLIPELQPADIERLQRAEPVQPPESGKKR